MTSTRSLNLANVVLLKPPELGLARLRIVGFASLKPAEQLQAAALALHRDLSVEPAGLRIATRPAPDSANEALVGFCSTPVTPALNPATNLLAAMQPGFAYWVDAPSGFIVGARGAAAVEIPATQHELPEVVAGTLASIGPSNDMRCILVNRDRAVVTDERIAWWAAASGVAIVDGELPASPSVPLVVPPRTRIVPKATTLDRALAASALACLLCVLFAGMQYATVPPSPSAAMALPASAKSVHATAGALLDRIGSVTPAVAAQTQTATYASGAWVLSLPDAFPAETLKRAALALEANGLAAQTTTAPSPRLRVHLP